MPKILIFLCLMPVTKQTQTARRPPHADGAATASRSIKQKVHVPCKQRVHTAPDHLGTVAEILRHAARTVSAIHHKDVVKQHLAMAGHLGVHLILPLAQP